MFRVTFLRILMGYVLCLVVPTVAAAGLIGVHHETGDLYTILTGSASVAPLKSTGVAYLGSLESGADGYLYGFTTGTDSQLYKIDPDPVGDPTIAIGPLNIGFVFEGALVFAPDVGKNGVIAYGTNYDEVSSCHLFTIDMGTGQATDVGIITPGEHDINGLAWRDDGMLVGLDRKTEALLVINPGDASVVGQLADLSSIGDETEGIGGIGGMTAVGGNMAYFATGGPDASPAGTNELYTVNLITGDYSLVDTFDPAFTGDGIGGLAVPTPATGLLIGVGALALIKRRRR